MKGNKRKSKNLDKIPDTFSKIQKLHLSDGNLENGLTHVSNVSLSFVKESPCSSTSISKDEKTALKSIYDEDNMETLTKCSEEILRIVNSMMIPETNVRLVVETVTNDLRSALVNLREPYDIVPFGSFINGLVCNESDLDFFLKTDSKCKSSTQIHSLLNKAASELRRSRMFEDVCKISMARIPIVRFIHKSIGRQCDLSFTNEIGVRNTLLIRFYQSLNLKLKPLVLFLKYLLDLHDLHGCHKITTYMLFWLVVYYLQQRDLLPPVQSVRELVHESYIVNGWDCRVPAPFVDPVSDSISLFCHLKAFLKFYSEFPFLKCIISPYLACPIPIADFENMRIPYDRFSTYFHKVQNAEDTTFYVSYINLQDPTELNVNITKQVELTALNQFRIFCYCLYNFFDVDFAQKFMSHGEFKKILPKTIPKSYCNVPNDCIQCEIHRLTINRLPEKHALRKTFTVNGVFYFANQLEKILKSKYECDVETIISDHVVRINQNKGKLCRKAVPVAYFACFYTKPIAKGNGDSEIIFSRKEALKAELFVFMDTTFGGHEIRIWFESSAAFLRHIGTHIIKLLVEVSE